MSYCRTISMIEKQLLDKTKINIEHFDTGNIDKIDFRFNCIFLIICTELLTLNKSQKMSVPLKSKPTFISAHNIRSYRTSMQTWHEQSFSIPLIS